MVFVVNVAVAAALFPRQYFVDVDADDMYPRRCSSLERCFFFGQSFASFGAGCVAAFLRKRARDSAHVRSACGYATVNWFQSIIATLTFMRYGGLLCETSIAIGGPCCRYGVMPTIAVANVAGQVAVYSRFVLYVIVWIWMQLLVAARLDLLEQSSNQKLCGRCFRNLVWMQALGGILLVFLLVFLYAIASVGSLLVIVGFTWLCNMAASTVAIYSLIQCCLQLAKVLRLAEGSSSAAASFLRPARRLAALQVMGVSASLVSTSLVMPAIFVNMLMSNYVRDHHVGEVVASVMVLVQVLDCLGNAIAVLLLSGSHRLPASQPGQTSQRMSCCEGPPQRKALPAKKAKWSYAWEAKVDELSLRGMTLRSLLLFYQECLPSMPDWRYSPKEHKTRDVVRRAIIPLTSSEETAYAVSVLNKDGARRAQVMVTHNWGNCYKDLLAAVISDALQECSFNLAAQLLEEDSALLCEMLTQSCRLDDTYWICAFAANQHICICHSNPYDRDPVTHELHPVCSCNSVNIVDPDGRSTVSEINKFDDMMYHLAATGGCRQVIAVDQELGLFGRAWCIAELAEAKRLQMDQTLQLASRAAIMQHAHTLENLDVGSMRASSEADKELILSKIKNNMNIDQFNTELRSLILDPKSGLLASWCAMDSLQQFGEVGRLIRWGLADAGTGKVWKAWKAQECSYFRD